MADAQRTIELIFKGVDQVSAVSDAVINSTRNFAGGVESATQPMADLTVNALQLEAGILAAGAAMTSVAVIAAGQFDSAFREIDTLVDAPVEAMSQFQQELLEYSATSTQSFDSIQAATYSAISAGVDYTESLSALSTAPYSDVGWTPLFAKAGAVVSESGGMLSHTSIVAREYRIPAVVSVAGACRLEDGSKVTVNGYNGDVALHTEGRDY